MRFIHVAAVSAAFLGSLELGASVAQAQVMVAPSCVVPTNGGVVYWFDTIDVKPGEHVELRALWTDRPSHFEPIPAACVKRLKVSPPAIVRLLKDHSGMVISSDAPDGSLVTVEAKVGRTNLTAKARVSVPASNPLIGMWTERSASCPPTTGGEAGSRIVEFALKSKTFSVTWQPFESYHDYTGDYSFDIATGALRMTATDGSYIPHDAKLNGTAGITPQGWLEVSGVNFGTPRSGVAHADGCTILFEKM
jgi:hypothetical protein